MYIIVWRHSYREPFIDTDSHGFIDSYPTYEDAKRTAEEIKRTENTNQPSTWYFDYMIYEQKGK
jgi:hypothetical protein